MKSFLYLRQLGGEEERVVTDFSETAFIKTYNVSQCITYSLLYRTISVSDEIVRYVTLHIENLPFLSHVTVRRAQHRKRPMPMSITNRKSK